MDFKVYIANAFSESRFGGNPAAVVSLQQWLSDELMQQIAAQHNLAETAFIVPHEEDYAIRWFTPTVEVDLCGHATLASAHIFWERLGCQKEKITFHSRSGPLHVSKTGEGMIQLDFPADEPVETKSVALLDQAFQVKAVKIYKSAFDFMVVLNSQEAVEKLCPDFSLLQQLPSRGTIVTAPGDDSDFVSRCFFPQSGINEDPVTGSAHTAMAPYWSKRLGKDELSAIQLSARKGYLYCKMAGNRVLIRGHAHTYLSGEFYI